MLPSDRLNAAIATHHPAASACMSDLGRAMYYPQGVAAQAQEAKGARINATIGQLTDGQGGALALPSMAARLVGLPLEDAVLYAAQGGRRDLREAWRRRLVRTAGDRISLPLATAGITHGLSTIADLFAGPDTDVLLPDPAWGNYRHLFATRRAAPVYTYAPHGPDGFDPGALRVALQARARPTLLVLNFPSNPSGYTPTVAEADELVEIIADSPVPLVVMTDDAYQGMVWEDGLLEGSMFDRLLHLDPARVLPVKVDGATKELFFFGGRVGFVTFGATGAGAAALEEKALSVMRATTSATTSFSQALVLDALSSPDLDAQCATLLSELRARYRALRDGLRSVGLTPWPYNSAFFALVHSDRDPEVVRRELLAEGIGVVAIPEASAIRLSYASVDASVMGELVSALAAHLAPR